jgi:hypothetical protein
VGHPGRQGTFGLYDNKLVAFARKKVEHVMWAAGAEEVVQESWFAHLVGGARMGADRRTSVTDRFGRTHDVDRYLGVRCSAPRRLAGVNHRASPAMM